MTKAGNGMGQICQSVLFVISAISFNALLISQHHLQTLQFLFRCPSFKSLLYSDLKVMSKDRVLTGLLQFLSHAYRFVIPLLYLYFFLLGKLSM